MKYMRVFKTAKPADVYTLVRVMTNGYLVVSLYNTRRMLSIEMMLYTAEYIDDSNVCGLRVTYNKEVAVCTN